MPATGTEFELEREGEHRDLALGRELYPRHAAFKLELRSLGSVPSSASISPATPDIAIEQKFRLDHLGARHRGAPTRRDLEMEERFEQLGETADTVETEARRRAGGLDRLPYVEGSSVFAVPKLRP